MALCAAVRPIRFISPLLILLSAGLFATPSDSSITNRQVEQASQALARGDRVQVIQFATQALEHGENADLRNLLGKAYAQSGEPAKANVELRSAIRLQPNSESFRFDLAQFLLRSEDFGTATTVLQDALLKWPRSAQIQLALGVAYYCTVRYDDAVRAFLRTMELAPDVEQPYVFLGKMLTHATGHLKEIANACAVSERLSPANPYAPLLHAEVLLAEPRPIGVSDNADATATRLLEKSIALKSDSAEAYFVLGSLMDTNGNYAKATPLLEKCVQLKPDDPVARYRLGRLYARLGKRDQADAQFAEQAKLKQENHRGQQ
jgi:Flp pilus assembly protein TadD